MQKVMTFIMAIVLVVSVTGCGSSKSQYEYEHIGIYDTKTEQYVDIGDSKDKVDRILGNGITDDSSKYFDYAQNLTVRYDENSNVEYMTVLYSSIGHDAFPERYTLPDGTACTNTVTDFIKKYPYVYICDQLQQGEVQDNVCIIVQKTKNGSYVLSKEELLEMDKSDSYEGDFYLIQVDYFSYDDIHRITITREIYPDIRTWDKYLVDIEK